MIRRGVARALALGVGATLLLAAWYFLAPPQLGGSTAYVTTVGSSMEPLLHPGDLIVVRRSASYEVGDVVAYRNEELRSVVLHRIVGREGDLFVLQGDNNAWLDSSRPAQDDLVGEMVIRLPNVGGWLESVRSPWGASSLVAVGAIGVLGGRRRLRGRRGRGDDVRRHAVRPKHELRGERDAGRRSVGMTPGVWVFAAVTLVGVGLGATSFLLPPTQMVAREVIYEQRGTFSYHAWVPGGGVVYGTDMVSAGDPVYLRLTDRVEVGFDYRFGSPAAADLAGTASLVAELSDVNGWSRSVELAPSVAFEGAEVSIGGVLDLNELQRLTTQLERATGVDRLAYSVDVVTRVEIEGTLAGHEVSAAFEPRLAFLLDDFQLQLELGVAPQGEQEAGDPLEPSAGGLIRVSREEPRTLGALGVEVGLEPLRVAAAAIILVGAVGLLASLARRLRAARRGEPALIEARFGQWLVPIHTNGEFSPQKVVEVESFESLLRVANHYGHMVLHDLREDGHAYLVEEGGVTYRYRPRSPVRVGR